MKKEYFMYSEDIMEKYPKSAKFYAKKMRRALTRSGVISTVDYSFGAVYEFFDSQNIIIEILAETIDENLTFFYKIYYLRRPPSPLYAIQVNFPNRQEAEQAAFENAFEILERKLS